MSHCLIFSEKNPIFLKAPGQFSAASSRFGTYKGSARHLSPSEGLVLQQAVLVATRTDCGNNCWGVWHHPGGPTAPRQARMWPPTVWAGTGLAQHGGRMGQTSWRGRLERLLNLPGFDIIYCRDQTTGAWPLAPWQRDCSGKHGPA